MTQQQSGEVLTCKNKNVTIAKKKGSKTPEGSLLVIQEGDYEDCLFHIP